MYLKKSENLKIFELEEAFLIFHKETKKTYRMSREEYECMNLFFEGMDLELIAKNRGVELHILQKKVEELKRAKIIEDEISRDKTKNTLCKWKKGIVYDDRFFYAFVNKCGVGIEFIYYLSFPLLVFSIICTRGNVDIEGIISQVGIFEFIVMDFIAALAISVHEVAHAFFAIKNGAFVGELGVKMDFFTPMAYTTICGIDTLKRTYKKIQIYAAGLTANAMMAAISLLLMNINVFKNSVVLYMCFSVNVCLILGNCVTAFKTDGHYILSIILNEPDFYESIKKFLSIETNRKYKVVIYACISYVVQPIIVIILLNIALKKI